MRKYINDNNEIVLLLSSILGCLRVSFMGESSRYKQTVFTFWWTIVTHQIRFDETNRKSKTHWLFERYFWKMKITQKNCKFLLIFNFSTLLSNSVLFFFCCFFHSSHLSLRGIKKSKFFDDWTKKFAKKKKIPKLSSFFHLEPKPERENI